MSIRDYLPESDFDCVYGLYEAVGWTAYTNDPVKLGNALEDSTLVLLFTEGDQVLGLIRCISDGHTICYIQDILVNPTNQRNGIGKALVENVLENFSHVRQIVLMTDNQDGQKNFYEAVGFQEIKGDLRGFVRIQS